MAKGLHRIFHHKEWLTPFAIALIVGPILIALHLWLSWAVIWTIAIIAGGVTIGIVLVILGIVLLVYIFEKG